MGTVLLLGIAGKKAQAGPPPPITCTIQGIPAPPVHGSVKFDYTIIAYGQSKAPLEELDVYSSNDKITFLNKGTYMFLSPLPYKGQHAFNEANEADGGYWWEASTTDLINFQAYSDIIGQYISP